MTAPHPVAPARAARYNHQVLLYRSAQEYVDRGAAFLRAGLAVGEPAFVMAPRPNLELLDRALGPEAASVRFVDLTEVGRNPARLIPLLRDLVAAGGGGPVRGLGEPIWPGRRPAELAEALLHEGLIDLAFADGPPLVLRCPYNAAALDASVVAAGCARHAAANGQSPDAWAAAEFARPLPPAGHQAEVVVFTEVRSLPGLRALIAERASQAGMGEDRTVDFVLAVHEVAVNSLRHGGGRGTLRLWTDDAALVCEVSDAGHIDQPLVGRVRPGLSQRSGRGVWLANQLCDLVQLRSSPAGTVVRLQVSRRAAAQS